MSDFRWNNTLPDLNPPLRKAPSPVPATVEERIRNVARLLKKLESEGEHPLESLQRLADRNR